MKLEIREIAGRFVLYHNGRRDDHSDWVDGTPAAGGAVQYVYAHGYTLLGYATKEAAARAAFPLFAWPGGAPIEYLAGDCVVLCADCAIADYLAEGSIAEGWPVDERPSRGQTCEGCSEYIPGLEPHCVECATDESDEELYHRPTFFHEEGEHALCARCMASYAVGRNQYGHTWPRAAKVGRLAYDLPRGPHAPWYGAGIWRAT